MKYIKLLSLFSILLISCSKKSKLGKLIPKEAAIVVHFNGKSLLTKLPWDEIKKTYWFNQMLADSTIPATAKTIFNDPEKTGINIQSDFLFFMLHPDNNGYAVAEGNVKDNKTFTDFIKSMHPNVNITKDGDLNLIKTSKAVLGWNNDRFVFVANADHKMPNSNFLDSTNATLPIPKSSPEDLAKVCKDIFALSSDNSLYDNEKFAKLEDEDGDIHFWMNINELTKSSMQNMPGMMGIVKLDKFLQDNYSTATINFKDGKITGTHTQYFGKELSDIVKKGDGNLNAEMIKRIGSSNIAGIYAFHISPSNLLEIIKLTGLDGFINLFMAQKGITLDEAVTATKGDIVFAVSDITLKNDSIQVRDTARVTNHPIPGATFLFAVDIGNKDAFNKLVNISKSMGKDVTNTNTFSKSDDKLYALSNSQDAVDKYFSGTQSNPDFLSKINDHPIGGFLDLQMILKALQHEFKDSADKVLYEKSIALWNNVYITGGEYKDGGIVTNYEVNLMDKNANSLQQLNKYADDNARIIIEKRKLQKEQWSKDTLVIQPKTDSAINRKQRRKLKK